MLSSVRNSLQKSKEIAGEAVQTTVDSLADKIGDVPVKAEGAKDVAAALEKWKYLRTPEIVKFAEQAGEPLSVRDAYSLKRELSDFAVSSQGHSKAMATKLIEAVDNGIIDTEKSVLGTNFFEQANELSSKRIKVNNLLEKHLLGKPPAGKIEELLPGELEVAGEKKAVSVFKSPQQGAMRLAEKLNKTLPEEQQFLENMKDTLAAREFQGMMGPLARTGLTSLGIYGLSRLNPAALALAPFLSPRAGVIYGRGLGALATGTVVSMNFNSGNDA